MRSFPRLHSALAFLMWLREQVHERPGKAVLRSPLTAAGRRDVDPLPASCLPQPQNHVPRKPGSSAHSL